MSLATCGPWCAPAAAGGSDPACSVCLASPLPHCCSVQAYASSSRLIDGLPPAAAPVSPVPPWPALLQDRSEEQRARRRRLLSAAASARIRRGMIRYVQVVLDLSRAASLSGEDTKRHLETAQCCTHAVHWQPHAAQAAATQRMPAFFCRFHPPPLQTCAPRGLPSCLASCSSTA